MMSGKNDQKGRSDAPIPSDASASASNEKMKAEQLRERSTNLPFKPKLSTTDTAGGAKKPDEKSPMDCVMPKGFDPNAKPAFKKVDPPKKK